MVTSSFEQADRRRLGMPKVRIGNATTAKALTRNHVRCLDAASVRGVLSQPPVNVSAGTTELASAHIVEADRAHPVQRTGCKTCIATLV